MRCSVIKRLAFYTAPVSFAVSAIFATAYAKPSDLLLVNGEIYTPNGWSEALAISDGLIVAVGTAKDAKSAVGKDAQIIDLKGKTVLPGIHDMHVHPAMAGHAMKSCLFAQGSTIEDIKSAVAACAKTKKPGEWIIGGQWQAGTMSAADLNKASLDSVAPNNPVMLVDISGHSQWLNSRALEISGITRDTPNPQGGIIEKDANGEPTGVLRESATSIPRDHIPPATLEQNADAIEAALDTLVSFGITSLVDAYVLPDALAGYVHLGDQGKIIPKVRGCYGIQPELGPIKLENPDPAAVARKNFALDCIKIFMDGVPTDSHTGAMLDPYTSTDPHSHGKPEHGLLFVPPEQLNPIVTKLDKDGLVIKFHAAGDWAVRTAIDAVEAARQANGMNGPTHDIGHLTFVSKDDIGRAVKLNATLEYSPYLWFPQAITADIIKVTGDERNKRAWPVKEGLDTGANVVVGSDWSVVPTPNPWIAIETLVTRKAPGGEGEPYGAIEAVTLEDAITLFTINGAKQLGLGDKSGTIEKGKIADLAIVDKNPFKIAITEVHTIKNVTTIIDGKVVYDATKSQ